MTRTTVGTGTAVGLAAGVGVGVGDGVSVGVGVLVGPPAVGVGDGVTSDATHGAGIDPRAAATAPFSSSAEYP